MEDGRRGVSKRKRSRENIDIDPIPMNIDNKEGFGKVAVKNNKIYKLNKFGTALSNGRKLTNEHVLFTTKKKAQKYINLTKELAKVDKQLYKMSHF